MTPEALRALINGDDLTVPYVIETRGGKTYTVTHRSNAHITESYPNTLIVATEGGGIAFLGLDAIVAIRSEHAPGHGPG
jgi:hypothetical protein